jgi:hypothetical protein
MLIPDMDIQRLKQEWSQPRQRPWRRSPFTRISSIVKAYALGESFLRTLDSPLEALTAYGLSIAAGKVKAPLELPLFALAPETEYHLAMSIIRKIDNPYLDYVQDPDEILLCGPLYLRHPHLDPDELSRFHFAALLRRESAPTGQEFRRS